MIDRFHTGHLLCILNKMETFSSSVDVGGDGWKKDSGKAAWSESLVFCKISNLEKSVRFNNPLSLEVPCKETSFLKVSPLVFDMRICLWPVLAAVLLAEVAIVSGNDDVGLELEELVDTDNLEELNTDDWLNKFEHKYGLSLFEL